MEVITISQKDKSAISTNNIMNMEEERKFYTCKYDVAFKEVFSKDENKDLLKLLLEHI